MKPMYILTAADGFTTCVAAEPVLVAKEVVRLGLKLPVEVVQWTPLETKGRATHLRRTGWLKGVSFTWPIEGRTWP